MAQRRDSQYARGRLFAGLAAIVAIVLIAGAVYFFALRDDDEKSPNSGKDLQSQTFNLNDVPFTFTYPGNFAGVSPTPEGFVWVSGIGPYDIIDVKRLSNQERTLSQTKSDIKQVLQARPDVKIVGEGTESTGAGMRMIRFNVETNVSGQTLQSSLYYFSLSGASWQLECQSTPKGRVEIGAACVNVLATLRSK